MRVDADLDGVHVQFADSLRFPFVDHDRVGLDLDVEHETPGVLHQFKEVAAHKDLAAAEGEKENARLGQLIEHILDFGGRHLTVVVVTKCDEVPPERVVEQLLAVSELGDWADVVPVSAVTGFQLDVLADVLVSHLPEGMPLYPDGELTDEPEQIMVAELIREAALDGVRDELPHSIAVVVEEMGRRPGREDLTDVHAELYVERPSQKAIVIGTKGARLKEVGSRARYQIEALLGTKVYLDLRVKIAKDWQRNPKQLRRLGFYD